jgi:hypothetical protein
MFPDCSTLIDRRREGIGGQESAGEEEDQELEAIVKRDQYAG